MQGKTIVLIDFENGGHREAFMQFFAKALLELGHEVLCIMPDTSPIQHWINSNLSGESHLIHYFNISVGYPRFQKFGRLNEAFSKITLWKKQQKILQKIEIQTQKKIDLVYFNWIDSQMANYLPAYMVDAVFHYKWSGLYFHPVIFRQRPQYLDCKTTFRDVDGVFLSKNCVAITMHDEGILEKYQKRIGKHTMLFPEIADATPAHPEHALARRIRQQSNNRTIVGIIGLEPFKGALSLIRLAKIADPSLFFFAFTGVFKAEFLDRLPAADREEFSHFMNNLPENCLWQTGGLKEGEDYNSVFCSFDIIHIVYNNFYSSSNRLTKAAIFNKLVLASNYGCVGEDVPTYDLGETVDENDIAEQYSKLQILRNRIIAKKFPYTQWKTYATKHSTDILPEKFTELLSLL